MRASTASRVLSPKLTQGRVREDLGSSAAITSWKVHGLRGGGFAIFVEGVRGQDSLDGIQVSGLRSLFGA